MDPALSDASLILRLARRLDARSQDGGGVEESEAREIGKLGVGGRPEEA